MAFTSVKDHPLLAREGRVHIALAAGVAALTHYFAGAAWAAPLWAITIFVTQFFRDPPRRIPTDPGLVVSPADGRVIAVGETHDPYLGRRARRVSIFMNVFNVHTNRIPVDGNVLQRWYHPGCFFNAALDKASADNERNAVWIKTNEGQDVVVVQVAGLIARRILCYVKPGDRVEQGARYGFIRFGSRVDVYLPLEAEIRVRIGDRTKGGSRALASLGKALP